ncbi:amino acid permease [Sulfolobales archaeon HS-7]|nr:amino acid permease [Sulfolobales archaeon HS-7]
MGETSIRNQVKEADKQLRKVLSLQDLLFLSLGGIIGSGWLFSALDGAAIAGPSAIFSWIIGGVLIMFVGLAYAEISGMIPRTGGIVRYPHMTHGSYTGYILGWLYLLSAASVPAVEAEAVVEYAATYIPSLTATAKTVFGAVTVLTLNAGIPLAIVLMVIFFFLNYFGVKFFGKFNTGVTWWKLVLPTLTFILLLATDLHSFNFGSQVGGLFPSNVEYASIGIAGPSAMLYAIPSAGIIFSYLGFRQSVEYAGEGSNPQRDVPRAVLLSLGIALLVYTLLQVAFIGGLDWHKIYYVNSTGTPLFPLAVGNWTGLLSSTAAVGPFYTLMSTSGIQALTVFAYLLLVDAIISPSGTGWIYTGTSARTLYGIAADGYFPSFMLKLSKYKIPIYSLIAALIIGLIFLLPFPSWYLLVGIISSATVFTYIMGGIGLQVLRKTAPELKRPFKLPGARVLAPIATVAAFLIVYWSGFTTLYLVGAGVLIGLPLFYFLYVPSKMGISRAMSAILGIVEFAATLLLAFLGYYDILVPFTAGTITTTALTENFALIMAGLIVTYFVITYVTHVLANEQGKKEIRSGYWMLAFIFVALIIEFFGGFGYNPVIPFPYDTIVAAIVGLAFHYGAVYSGFRTEEIEDIVTSQEGV